MGKPIYPYFKLTVHGNSHKKNILGGYISGGPKDPSQNLTVDLVGTDLCHAKIRDFGPVIVIQQDVAALEISMDDSGESVFVKKLESPGAV